MLCLGCASTGNIDEASELSEEAAREDRSIVFGRVRWIQDGEAKEIGDSYFEMQLTPHLLRMEDKKRIEAEVDSGGHFVWSLEPGTYLMHMLIYRDPWAGAAQLVPKVAFAVPENGKVYYVGTLRATYEMKRDFLGTPRGPVYFSVMDERREEEQRLRDELGLEAPLVTSSVMRHDDRLPKSVETTEGFRIASVILTAIGVYGVGRY
ncbi:MAG: hypothetical protein ACYS0E_11055 [Planctomycetota bacterium]|jgi:hypothetical protein